jgi:hypothetical protein
MYESQSTHESFLPGRSVETRLVWTLGWIAQSASLQQQLLLLHRCTAPENQNQLFTHLSAAHSMYF